MFGRLRGHWRPEYMDRDQVGFYRTLPEDLNIFRGQDQNRDIGISWTLDRNVAERYAQGECSTNMDPTVIEVRIKKSDIAIVGCGFGESEIVPFNINASGILRFLPVGLKGTEMGPRRATIRLSGRRG